MKQKMFSFIKPSSFQHYLKAIKQAKSNMELEHIVSILENYFERDYDRDFLIREAHSSIHEHGWSIAPT